jgi:hypothetical protein
MLAQMAQRELDRIRTHLEATRSTHALRLRITHAVQDLHDRLTPLRESWCQTNDPAHVQPAIRTLRPRPHHPLETWHRRPHLPMCNLTPLRCRHYRRVYTVNGVLQRREGLMGPCGRGTPDE